VLESRISVPCFVLMLRCKTVPGSPPPAVIACITSSPARHRFQIVSGPMAPCHAYHPASPQRVAPMQSGASLRRIGCSSIWGKGWVKGWVVRRERAGGRGNILFLVESRSVCVCACCASDGGGLPTSQVAATIDVVTSHYFRTGRSVSSVTNWPFMYILSVPESPVHSYVMRRQVHVLRGTGHFT